MIQELAPLNVGNHLPIDTASYQRNPVFRVRDRETFSRVGAFQYDIIIIISSSSSSGSTWGSGHRSSNMVVVIPTYSASHSDQHQAVFTTGKPIFPWRDVISVARCPVVSGVGGELSGEGFECCIFFLVHGSRVKFLFHGVKAYISKSKGSRKNDSLCSFIKCKASKFISLFNYSNF